jgi:hypothetical protein
MKFITAKQKHQIPTVQNVNQSRQPTKCTSSLQGFKKESTHEIIMSRMTRRYVWRGIDTKTRKRVIAQGIDVESQKGEKCGRESS